MLGITNPKQTNKQKTFKAVLPSNSSRTLTRPKDAGKKLINHEKNPWGSGSCYTTSSSNANCQNGDALNCRRPRQEYQILGTWAAVD